MSQPELIEDFFGVYLLYCINPKYLGRTYIGYTRDPCRRVAQHNRGTWAGGAWRTNNRGPWKMVLIVHGFPNNISALRFEWAWQNPNKTTRLQHLNLKRVPRKESEFQFKLRILSEMLCVGPWRRLPLLLRWLEPDYEQALPPERPLPDHMKICRGPVRSRNLKKSSSTLLPEPAACALCSQPIRERNSRLRCLNPACELVSHLACLAGLWLPPGEYVPIRGDCPLCSRSLQWGDLIRQMKGCARHAADGFNEDEGDEEEEDCEDGEVVCSQGSEFVDNNSVWLVEDDS